MHIVWFTILWFLYSVSVNEDLQQVTDHAGKTQENYALWTRDINMSVQINLLSEHYQSVLEIDQISKTIQLSHFVWQERLRLRKNKVLSSSRSGARNQDSCHILSSDSSRKLTGFYEDILQGCNYGSGIVSFFLALDCGFISKSSFFLSFSLKIISSLSNYAFILKKNKWLNSIANSTSLYFQGRKCITLVTLRFDKNIIKRKRNIITSVTVSIFSK